MSREYRLFNYPDSAPGGYTFLTGIRGKESSEDLHITGGYVDPDGGVTGLYYIGRKSGKGKWWELKYASTASETVLYGPNILHCGNVQAVGSYKTEQTGPLDIGCLYEGKPDGSGKWTTLRPPVEGVKNTIAHSTNGGLVVGNYDTELRSGFAFIYDIERKKYYTITLKEAETNTAYGIWYEGCGQYIICGGYSKDDRGYAYTIRLRQEGKKLKTYDFQSYSYQNDENEYPITHFDGIAPNDKGGYNLTGTGVQVGKDNFAFFASTDRKGKAKWSEVAVPGAESTTGNSVWEKIVIGVFTTHVGGLEAYISY